MKKATVLLLILGLVSFCSAAITTYTLGPEYVTLPFNGVLGQNSYTENNGVNSTIRQPAGLAFNSRGGLYVTDAPYTNNAGGRILYYENTSSNNPTSVLGAENVNSNGILAKPTSIAVYSVNGTDQVVAVSTGGTGYSKYYNVNGTNSGEGSDPIFNVVTSVGGPVSAIQAGNYLSLAIARNNPAVYFADTGNNRVVVQPNNSTAFPSTIYGTGSDGNAATCNTQTTTCFRSPTAVAVDCRQGVWMAVNSVNNVTLNAYGILYFPAGRTEATALYLPNRTLDFSQVFGISFNADCTRIAIAAVYRVYFGTVNLNYNPIVTIAPPEITRLYSIGAYDPNGAIPNPSADTDSLTTIQSVAFDNSNSRLAIGDFLHNRVVFVDYNSSVVPSTSRLANSSFSTSLSNSASRQPFFPSFSSSPTASNNFSTTASATLGTSSSPSPNTTTVSTSTTSSTVPSSVVLSNSSSSSNVPVGTPSASFTGTYTSISASAFSESASPTTPSGTPTSSPTISYDVSYTAEPTPSLSYVPEASVATTGGAAVRIQSWVQLF